MKALKTILFILAFLAFAVLNSEVVAERGGYSSGLPGWVRPIRLLLLAYLGVTVISWLRRPIRPLMCPQCGTEQRPGPANCEQCGPRMKGLRKRSMQGARALVVCLIALSATAGCSSNTPTAPGPPAGDQPPPSSTPAPPPPADPSAPPDSPPPPVDPSAPPDSPESPPPNQAPSITSHPRSQTISAGTGVTLTVKATGPGSLAYQWFAGSSGQTSSRIAGARDDKYTTPALTKTTRFWVRVSNAGGSSDSDTATISVDVPAEPQPAAPQITSQPKDRTVTSGQSATLSVSATGTGPLTYRWYEGQRRDTSSPVSGATASSYTTPPLTKTTRYWVRVSNGAGAADSDAATITVTAPQGDSGFEATVLDLVNARRASGATCGGTPYGSAPALSLNTKLRSSARGHSDDMAVNDYFSHTSLDGRTFDQRIRDAGYTGSFPLGENIAAGQSSPQAVVNALMSSAGHCRDIMDPGFRAVGIGYTYDPESSYGHYWTQDFGGS